MNKKKDIQKNLDDEVKTISAPRKGFNLFVKINLLIFIVVLLSVSSITWFSIKSQTRNLQNALLDRNQYLVAQAAQAVQGAFFTLNWEFVQNMLKKTLKDKDILWVCIFKSDGEVYLCGDQDNAYQGKIASVIAKKNKKDSYLFWFTDQQFEIISQIPIGSDIWYVSLGGSMAGITLQNRELINTNLLWGLLTILFGMIAATIFLVRITRPLSEISEAAQDIAHGNLSRMININTGGEIGVLADQFNLMSRALKKSYNSLKDYSNDLEEEVKNRTRDQQIVNRRLQSILDTTDQGFWLIDNHLVTKEINPRMAQIMGRAARDILDRSILDFFTGADRDFLCEKLSKRAEGTVSQYEVALERPNNYPISCLVSVTPLMLGDQAAKSGTFVMFTDISKLKDVEQKLLIAKKNAEKANRAKSEFLANMSHELRTPLSGILGFTQVLEIGLSENLSIKQKGFFNHIKNSSDHLLEMVNDILDLAKIEAGKTEINLKPFEFGKMLERTSSIIRSIAFKKNIQVEMNIQPGFEKMNGDETKLKQVVFNLLSNAVKFTEPGKKIGVNAVMEGDSFEVTVWDEGIGIPEDYLKKIFTPFEQVKGSRTSKEKGTGLGLTISKKLLELHKGTLNVTSKVGKGSRFTITLPGRILGGEQVSLQSVTQQNEINTSLIKDIKILVTEDNEINRELIEAVLDEHPLDFAVSGEAAVTMALKKEYDLILMDIQLPGIDGVEAMKQIKKNSEKYIPIIALTGFAMKGDEQKYLNEGFDDYSSKPFNFELLRKKIEKNIQ